MTERLCTFDQDNLEERGKATAEYKHLYEVWGEGQIGVIVLGSVVRTQFPDSLNE